MFKTADDHLSTAEDSTSAATNRLAAAMAEMTSYAFLTHRRDFDDSTSGGPLRKEAFVEMCLHYLLQMPLGGKVLWAAVTGSVDDYKSAGHVRQFISDNGRPDFSVTVNHPDGEESRVLVELKIQDKIGETQNSNYLTLRLNETNVREAHLVSLSPWWNDTCFTPLTHSHQNSTKPGSVKRLTFEDLSNSAASMRAELSAEEVAMWTFLTVTANGMRTPVPPLPDAGVLNSSDVVVEFREWLDLFETIGKELRKDQPGREWESGFTTNPAHGTALGERPLQHRSISSSWVFDMGESVATGNDADRSPLWLFHHPTVASSGDWVPLRLGRRAASSWIVDAARQIRNSTSDRPVRPLKEFVGQGAGLEFEDARRILWTAMQSASSIATELDWTGRERLTNPDGYGLRLSKRGTSQFVDVTLAVGDDTLRITVDGDVVTPSHHDSSGRDYVNRVVSWTRQAIGAVTRRGSAPHVGRSARGRC